MTNKEIDGAADRIYLRKAIADLVEITEKNQPSLWLSLISEKINFQQKEQQNAQLSNPQLAKHISYSLRVLSRLLSFIKPTNDLPENTIVERTEHFLMQFSMKRARIHEQKHSNEHELTQFISLDELADSFPDRIRKTHKILSDETCLQIPIIELQIRHPIRDEWHSIPLPINEKIWHKGGPARAILNIVAGAPLSMQLAEYPWNDLDVITAGNNHRNYQISTAIGVDPDGIEYMGEKQLNFPRYTRGRDTDQNQCCLGSDGLYFTQAAFNAAKTGHISIVGEYIANKAIYGFDVTVVDGIPLVKPRGLMRLLKNLAEGKALSFDYKPVNNNFDVSIYILFLAKKWSKRTNFVELMQNLFYLLQQLGQIQPSDTSIIDVLERAHRRYSFFDFDREISDKLDLTRWKNKKLGKQFDREAAMLFGLPSGLEIIRSADDEVPMKISLGSFKPNSSESERILNWWPTFVSESKLRTASTKNVNMTMYERLFYNEPLGDELTFDHDVFDNTNS